MYDHRTKKNSKTNQKQIHFVAVTCDGLHYTYVSCDRPWHTLTDSDSDWLTVVNSRFMSHIPGSPDTPGRSLPSWAALEATGNIDEALKSLETYKKKDPSKGTFPNTRVEIRSDLSSRCQWLWGLRQWEMPQSWSRTSTKSPPQIVFRQWYSS